MIDNPPTAGRGVHNWMFRLARQLHAHMPANEIIILIKSKLANCGRRVPDREIVQAVQHALACAWQPNYQQLVTSPTKPNWPDINEAKRAEIIRNGSGLADLWEASPARIEDNRAHTEEIIDQLFPGDPLLCCGQSNSSFETKSRSEWREQLSSLPLIVPSPMTARTGLTKEGRESAHSLSNTGPRRFLICEFDAGTTDDHAALLAHLSDFGPLVLAVHSGGKSLHGWFYCAGQPEEKLQRFMRYAVSLGADRATWTRSQFVRMPDGTRDNGNRQTVFYFNPGVIR
jgi:hypothetical protein